MNQPKIPDPIPHLISAVNALGLALRDLNALTTDQAVRQDSHEHATKVEGLVQLLIRLLQER